MRTNNFKATFKAAVLAAGFLPFAAVVAFGQQQINLTAAPASITLPDGSSVPMWGYSCGTLVGGSTATCAKLNPAATGWSPVVITVPTTASGGLTINLTNNLTFGATHVPTSLVIVGQLGGGLGTITPATAAANFTASPDHSNAQETTWPIANPAAKNPPPPQGQRVQSFATQVASGATTLLPAWANLRPGTYLIESGTHPSIQGPMGLYGMLVVTCAPTDTTSGCTTGSAYPGVTYNADVPLLLSEIDPVQNNAVNTAVNTAGFMETKVWSGQPGGCGNPSSTTYHTCYPPAVNYTPLYYLFNGVAFNKTSAAASLFPASLATTPVTGNVLVRFVNAGLRMHVPSIVGSKTGASAIPGLSLIAEDGNPLPGVPRVQNEVFLAAGKTYDVMINAPAAGGSALPVFDRQLSLSGNATGRDEGMLAYIGINGAGIPASSPALLAAIANPDTYTSVVTGQTLSIMDPSKGVIANDVNVYGVKVSTAPTKGALTLNPNGTFIYVPNTGWTSPDSFVYQANGSGPTATVTLSGATIEAGAGIIVNNIAYTSNVATSLSIKSPGVLSVDKDTAGFPLTVAASSVVPAAGLTLSVDKSGGFNASVPGPGIYTFTYKAQNSQGTLSTAAATVTLTFPTATGLVVTVVDGKTLSPLSPQDYRWIIEEDRTFYIDPNCTTNPPPAGCPTFGSGQVPTFGTSFHTSYMPVVATGCVGPAGSAVSCEAGQKVLDPTTGNHVNAVCDIGNGVCRPGAQQAAVDPSQVHLDPTKRYYISVLPGDGATPFETGNGIPGHGMGGAQIAAGQTRVRVLVEPTPFPPSKLSVFVYEDDFPLNGEQDGGGGIDVLSPNEPGLGGFNITLFDDAGGSGDATGQMTYDMFNQPLVNSLAGTKDPATGKDACPISANALQAGSQPTSPTGITGTIVTCPKYESDNVTLSPLAGQVVVANLMPGRYGVVATPAADRIGRGEEWLQTNTLDGQKAHDSFLRIGEPSFFQEFGPAGYHVSIGFANPQIINARLPNVCNGSDPNITGPNCTNSVKGTITTERMSRTPDERLYSSGSNDSFSFTQCYVSFGDPDGEDFAFTKCAADGSFSLSGLPDGSWRITVFDQWNDMLVDGLSTPVLLGGGATTDMGQIAMNQWQSNIYTSTFLDQDGNGIRGPNEPGLPLVATNNRFRDGSFSNFNNTDLSGNAGFNEIFPLFSWYVIETDSTRYKNTGTHVVYDAGGPADSTCSSTTAPCGSSVIGQFMANTFEQISVPPALRVPGAIYCEDADCTGTRILPGSTSTAALSTGRIDPPWVVSEGWQGFSGQNEFIEFGKIPYVPGENGGIRGHVVYASTRPFDDPQLLLQTSWEPLVPNVTINLYQEGFASDNVTPTLQLVDSTKTSSFDDWAQGFRSDGVPNMNCPGQGRDTGTDADIFFFSLYNQPNYLDFYNSQHGGPGFTALPANAQFKCYDGMHNWNQIQPAPYDGMYLFPSIAGRNPTTGAPTGGTGSVTGTNCTICVANPTDGTPMLPSGKYVVEVVVPPGYELVKEEDKNILIGDNYIAPVTVQFPGLGAAIYILPDQAAVGATYNPNNPQNPTTGLGRISNLPSHEGDTGSVESFWPCVGQARIVPDYISLFPQSKEVAPFAGATRPLCDRKEVSLDDQTQALAKFYIFTSTHAAAHYTGVITDDYTSEFDPFSPQFGEKFAPPNLPISFKDWTGTEISRTYTDHWGAYNGLTYSTWEVNPPNPTGYAPTMMVTCMNDPGTGATPDPLFNPAYSQFCYEIPFMPGQTQYMDTPVVPTSAFAGAGYNNVDCAYPNATPAIKEVDGDGIGPWVSAASHTLTITALGDQLVNNNAYSGPSATTAPYNQKTITRHYGFGSATGTVTIGGRPASVTGWSDSQITVTVPGNVPACTIQQQPQYGGVTAQCGQLIVTAANGKQSIDTVTVTVGGKTPTHVVPPATIQSALDTAAPGDLIIVNPGVYTELLLMWKPVRLQGVGAASSIINAITHPAGKLDPWRRQVNCLFGLALDGTPWTSSTGSNPYDSTGTYSCPGAGWTFFTAQPNNPQVDRLPLEATVGWDATLNGNLAELLQEPTLMGALEGAAITVLSKGVQFPAGSNPFAADTFPVGTTLLGPWQTGIGTVGSTSCTSPSYPSNFQCNPSSIDGMSITNSSQGGGGIFVHAWGHNLQIANNRVYNNTGTLSGGINVGQGEFPGQYIGGAGAANADPGSCQSSNVTNLQLPYCFDANVNIHNNAIMLNSSTGDELFSATPAGAGGVSFCTGADYYKFNYNWVCGNLSTGDGGGIGQLGFDYHGDIEHNSILFNQSTNPTIPANGGGIVIMGAPDVDPACGNVTDQDCLPPAGSPNGPSDGAGPGLVINANLIMGNAAESGTGGALRFQNVNGTEVANFPTSPSNWYSVTVTNNIIANNVAGWDGAGISLQDSLVVNIINNTIMSNDTTASSGVLFNTLGAPLASSGGSNCIQVGSLTASCPQPAGLVSIPNSPALTSVLPSTVTCPTGHGTGGTGSGGLTNANCRLFSYPLLANNVFWQNRSFYIGVGTLGAGILNQQNVVALYNSFTTTQAPSQPQADATTANGTGGGVVITGGTGACTAASYWDIGVRGDKGPGSHDSTFILGPTYSVLTNASENGTGSNNLLAINPQVLSQYCNGSRIPPELGSAGYQVPPGIADATVPNPIFSLTPAATVDEGNNWINISWGPLAMAQPLTGAILGNYAQAPGSPVVNAIPFSSSSTSNYAIAPSTDFFGNARKVSNSPVDIGAVELQAPPPTLASIVPNTGVRGTVVPVTITGTNLAGATAVAVSGTGVTVSGITSTATTVTATFTIATTAALTARNVSVTTPGGVSGLVTFTVTAPAPPTLASIAPTSGLRGTTVPVTLTGTNLTGTTALTVSGGGITVTAITVVSPTSVTANFVIATTATVSARNVTVTTPGGTSNAVTFTVSGPTLTSIAPVSGARGTAVPVTLTGTNLTGATAVTVAGGGITVTGITVVSSTTVTATFTISGTATLSARNVSVTTPIGTTNTVIFTVGQPVPVLSSIAPNTGVRGTTVPVVLTGTSLTGGTVAISGTGVTVSGITVVNSTTVNATFTIGAFATLGARTVTVTTAGGTSNTVTFTVQGATLASIAPTAHTRGGAAFTVTLTGTNLTGATAVNVSGGGVTVGALTVTPTTVTTTFTISATATQSARTVSVATPIGTTNNVTFTVQ